MSYEYGILSTSFLTFSLVIRIVFLWKSFLFFRLTDIHGSCALPEDIVEDEDAPTLPSILVDELEDRESRILFGCCFFFTVIQTFDSGVVSLLSSGLSFSSCKYFGLSLFVSRTPSNDSSFTSVFSIVDSSSGSTLCLNPSMPSFPEISIPLLASCSFISLTEIPSIVGSWTIFLSIIVVSTVGPYFGC